MRLKKLDKIRLLVLLPLSLAFIVFGTIILAKVSDNDQVSNNLTTSNILDTEDLNAQAPPPPPTFVVQPSRTPVPEPPRPTAIPTSIPSLSCRSEISYRGSGQELEYVLKVNSTGTNSLTKTNVDLRPYIANGELSIIEFTGNCRESQTIRGLYECSSPASPVIFFLKVTPEYKGTMNFKIETEGRSSNGGIEADSCDASMTLSGINTPPSGMPGYTGSGPIGQSGTTQQCEPLKDYCTDNANLLFDGSFENPVCTENPPGAIPQVYGDGCAATGDDPRYYQADTSALLPYNSMAFFTEGTEKNYQRAEYIPITTTGTQQCEEKLTAHGNSSYKIFSRGGFGLKAGLCIPIKDFSGDASAGINYRIAQQTGDNFSTNVDVTLRLGYITRPMNNNFYFGTMPEVQDSQVSWVDEETITASQYGTEEGAAERYAGGFLSGTISGSATGLCFMAESNGGNGIDTFWDAAFVSTEPNACENAKDHSDGIARDCGGYACGNVEPNLSGNAYVDFNQEYYPFDMPDNWRGRQCHYETETNGRDSEFGTLFAGLDLNNCDPNYSDPAQRNLHPEMDKPDVACANSRNWIYGYAWIGGIKDFGLLQYLDCAMSGGFKGTEANPFFCDQILKSYNNTIDLVNNDDPAFTLRYSNTYSGLINAVQGEGDSNFWKVPLLGSAVSSGVINNREVGPLVLDPFLINKRNSGSGSNNFLKFNLEDTTISTILRTEDHLYEESIVTNNEVMVESLLADGPICSDIEGDPITKIHYGRENGISDRAIFGFADDEGSFEHIIHAENNDISPETLCNYQFRDNRVVGATCTFNDIGEGRSVTFTEDNIGNTLEQEGYVSRVTRPTLPGPPGVPDDSFDDCQGANLCGVDWDCSATMRQLYDACIGDGTSETVDAIGGNPFIRQELPNGWRDLQVFGLNKVMESSWHNEFIQYNMPVRHENVGLDINQVVSLYDQQQPKCSIMPENRRPIYCQEDPVINKAQQVCRRVAPYNCNCGPSNFTTCLLDCQQIFTPPPPLDDVGIPIEGVIAPTLPPGADMDQPRDQAIRPILENNRRSFLERFVGLLNPKTYEGEGGQNYIDGQIYNYDPRYTGGFLLANTGSGTTQCTTQTGAGTKTGVSQVRIENYFPYGGQLARINERVGFAATNNKDPDSFIGETIDIENATVAELISYFVVRGEGLENIAIPYCDSLTDIEKEECSTSTDTNCDCLIRSCQQQFDTKIADMGTYLPIICEKLTNIPENEYHQRPISECMTNLSTHWTENIFKPAKDRCDTTPKTNRNFNCDPMANYLISQGFNTPELRLAACDEISNEFFENGNQCLIGDYDDSQLVSPLLGEKGVGWNVNYCYGPTKETQKVGFPPFTAADRALVERCKTLSPLGIYSGIDYDVCRPDDEGNCTVNSDDFGYFHFGLDMGSEPRGVNIPVYASGRGVVIKVVPDDPDPKTNKDSGFGNHVLIRHGQLYTRYAHLDNFDQGNGQTTQVGQEVDAFTRIGTMGTTGFSTGIHLHFDVLRCLDHLRNCYLDPTDIALKTRESMGLTPPVAQHNVLQIDDKIAISDSSNSAPIDSKLLAKNTKSKKQLKSEEIKTKSEIETKLTSETNQSIDLDMIDPHMYTATKQILTPDEILKANEGIVLATEVTLCERDFDGLDIVTREEWGAGGVIDWEPQCVTPQRIQVHHTAGVNNPPDSKDVLQKIWKFHAQGRGWGDIGYNYLIDHNGVIYEGRAGGEGVIGAHTAGVNQNSIGIAFMGNFMTEMPTQAALESFNKLVETKSAKYGFTLKWDETIFGHRDFDHAPCCCMNLTVCPGEVLYTHLRTKYPNGSSDINQPETSTCSQDFDCGDQTSDADWKQTQCYEDYLESIDSPVSTDPSDTLIDECYNEYGGTGEIQCLMKDVANFINSLPGGSRIPWEALYTITYKESWLRCSVSHVEWNKGAPSTFVGNTPSGGEIYEFADQCSGDPNQLGLYLDNNLVDKGGRGIGQFMPGTFDHHAATAEFQACINYLGVDRNIQSSERFWDPDAPETGYNQYRAGEPDYFGRIRVGDSLCAMAVKLSTDVKDNYNNGNYLPAEQWGDAAIRQAARNYYGGCGYSYCDLAVDRFNFAKDFYKDHICSI